MIKKFEIGIDIGGYITAPAGQNNKLLDKNISTAKVEFMKERK